MTFSGKVHSRECEEKLLQHLDKNAEERGEHFLRSTDIAIHTKRYATAIKN